MEADPESSDPGDPSRRMDIGIVPALPIKHKSYMINIFDLFQFFVFHFVFAYHV